MPRISVFIPNSFVPERKYVVHLLLHTLLNIPYEIETDHQLRITKFVLPNHTFIFKDAFFQDHNDPSKLYNKAHLPKPQLGTDALQDLTILYGTNDVERTKEETTLGFDIVGSTFFMATRWEEKLGPFDQNNRFLAESSIAHKFGFLKRPIVHEYALWLQTQFESHGLLVETHRTFKKGFDCDIDFPFYWDHNPFGKLLSAFGKKGLNFGIQQWRSYNDFKGIHKSDPYYTFDQMMDDAERNDIELQFYMMAGGNTSYDGMYQLSDPRIHHLIRQINSRKHQIGLHGSYNSYADAEMILQEKKSLEQVLGKTVTFGRQHFLRFQLPETWQMLDHVGFSMDSSVGYADQPGFRCGLCIPFPVFDIINRKQLDLFERPLIFMDATIRHYLGLQAEEGIDLVKELTDQVKKHRGEFVFLWHNSSFQHDGYELLKPIYDFLNLKDAS